MTGSRTERLIESEKKYRLLFDNMLNGFAYHEIVLDEKSIPVDYIFLEVNKAFEKLTGLMACEIIGKRVTAVLPGIEKDDFDWIGTYGKVALEGTSSRFISHSKELERWYSILAYSPEKGRFAVIFEDFTHYKVTEERINKLNTELEKKVKERTAELEVAVKDLESFSYSVSHDLRGPLRAIDGFSRILLEDYSSEVDDEGTRFLGIIRDNANRMGKLIDDILNFSRTGRKEIDMRPVDIGGLSDSVFKELSASVPERKIDFKNGELPSAHGDLSMIRQVLVNLISNAIKFTGTRDVAVIEMDARKEGDHIVYSLRDNGVGFDMKFKEKLFAVFQRLHSVDEFEGTGAGLAIAKRIINKHGGRVWAEGTVGEGATFWFSLPGRKES